jgi:hypothetical protein
MPYRLKPMLIPGRRYGRSTAIEFVEKDSNSNQKWRMQCTCGTQFVAYAFGLKNGRIRSCGCLQREAARELGKSSVTHGEGRGTREYNSWLGLRARCLNPNHPKFKDYGGRGITICARWSKYENFLADMGRCPPKLSLDRKNNDGPYSKRNCHWATAGTQANNRRSSR